MPWRIKIIIITLVFILLPTSFNVYANQGVYISEVNFAGSTRPDCKLCSYDKWIELFNPSEKAIDVSFWTLQFRESQDATNNLKFPPNTFIQAKSNYLVRNRYNGLTSTLSSANIQADAISGKVLRVSSNTAGQRRIQASLLNSTGQKISEFNLNESAISKLEGGKNLIANTKFSIEFNPDNSGYNISEKTYFSNNYGSPKFGSGVLVDLDKSQEAQVQAVVSPAIDLAPENKSLNIQPDKKVHIPSSAGSQIPVQATAQQSINIVSEVAPQTTSQTAPQITTQNIPPYSPQTSIELTPQVNLKISPKDKSEIDSENPKVLNQHIAPQVTPEVLPQAAQQNILLATSRITSQNPVLLSPQDTVQIASPISQKTPLDYKLKLSEIENPQVFMAQNSTDKIKLSSEKIDQTSKPLYLSLEDKTNINLWPLVLFMLASIAYQKSKTISKSSSFVNVLTKNLSMASN